MARILIVDDSFVVRRNLETILTRAGHQIVGIATNGRQAISLYMELKPDLITMDISMPIMDGVDSVKSILDIDREAKIIMVSALNQKKMVVDAITNGAKHYILKPIDEKQMLEVIRKVLNDNSIKTTQVEEKSIDNSNPGFHIENRDGEFNIIFGRSIELNQIQMLEVAINGLMFIKPLKVSFNFNNIFHISDSSLDGILRQKKRIMKSGGIVRLIVDDFELENRIRTMEF